MEIDHDVAIAFARATLQEGALLLTSHLGRNLDLGTGEFDVTVHAQAVELGKLGVSEDGYESRIVAWAKRDEKRVPVMDMERPTRDRLMHFLDRPSRVMLAEAPYLHPDRDLDLFVRHIDGGAGRRPVEFYRKVGERFGQYGYLTGPVEVEGDAQRAIHGEPFYDPTSRVAALLDGVDPASLPAARTLVSDEVVMDLANKTVGIILGLPDDGHLFWWSPGWERFAHVDDSKTTDHPDLYEHWWRRPLPEGLVESEILPWE